MAATQSINRSRRILSGRGEDESISRARTVMTSFERVWSITRQTAADQPRHKQVLRLFFEHLRAYTDEFGSLSLDVSPYALNIDGQQVLKIERKRENYINRLFLDGIRQLVFHPALVEDELLRFIDILRTDFTQPGFLEDDIVTLLWHEKLSEISYSVFDTTEESTTETVEVGDKADTVHYAGVRQTKIPNEVIARSADEMLLDPDEVMAQAMSDLPIVSLSSDKPEFDILPVVVSAGDRRLRVFAPAVLDHASEDPDRSFGFTQQQAKALRDQLRASKAMAPTKFGEVLFRSLQGLPEPAGDEILQGFGSFALSCLSLASEAPLAQVLDAMKPLGHTPEGKHSYARFLGKIQDAEVMDALVHRLEEPQFSEDLLNLVHVMGDDHFPILWERILSLTNVNARQHLLSRLTPFSTNHLPFLIGQVAKGREDEAMLALSLLKEIPISAIAGDLLTGLRHPASSIRLAVADMIRQADTPTVHQTLISMVNDPEEQVRLAVIQILTDTENPDLEKALLATLCKPGFARRNAEEKRRIIIGLGRVASRDGLSVLRSLALGSTTSPVKGDQDTQIAAIRALASRSDDDVLPGLKKISRAWFGNKEIKRAARFAVTVINRQLGKS